ncbi:MAG TPA: TIGR03067 domain-containing protein [Bacteroidia bacterium]|nr:TIGR03067 domain-containing protein [Bacteroidia bacterium]
MKRFSIGKAQTEKKELSKFQGVWSRTFGEVDMVTVPNFVFVDSVMMIRDNRATITEGGQAFEMEIVRLDTSTNPKHIDIKSLGGSEKDSISFGIYELEGDTLRICHSLKRQAMRPIKFEIPKGSGLVQSLWKRVKK